jgi:hypothetical protein
MFHETGTRGWDEDELAGARTDVGHTSGAAKTTDSTNQSRI